MKNSLLFFFALIIVLLFYSCSNNSNPTVVTTNTTNSGNFAPDTPKAVSPANSSTNVSRDVTVQWSCHDPNTGDTLSYDLYFDVNSPPAVFATNILITTKDIGLVYPQKKYYWRIVAKSSRGTSVTGPIWWFVTGSNIK